MSRCRLMPGRLGFCIPCLHFKRQAVVHCALVVHALYHCQLLCQTERFSCTAAAQDTPRAEAPAAHSQIGCRNIKDRGSALSSPPRSTKLLHTAGKQGSEQKNQTQHDCCTHRTQQLLQSWGQLTQNKQAHIVVCREVRLFACLQKPPRWHRAQQSPAIPCSR